MRLVKLLLMVAVFMMSFACPAFSIPMQIVDGDYDGWIDFNADQSMVTQFVWANLDIYMEGHEALETIIEVQYVYEDQFTYWCNDGVCGPYDTYGRDWEVEGTVFYDADSFEESSSPSVARGLDFNAVDIYLNLDGEQIHLYAEATDPINPAPVPEPATAALLSLGLFCIAGYKKKKH